MTSSCEARTVRPGGPATGGSTGAEKLFDDEILESRDFMNQGGKLIVTGENALEGAWEQFLYNPLGPTPPKPLCPQNTSIGQGALANDPPGQNFNCVAVSNDFQQYWLGPPGGPSSSRARRRGGASCP
jgi:hypothetical protein